MKTAVIILNYNNFDSTRNCVESIRRYNTTPVRLIVVDNGSSQHERVSLADYVSNCASEGLDCRFVECGENLGYARGNNEGLKIAYSDAEVDKVMILNNDILFVDDILPRLIELHDSITDCAIISPVLYKAGMEEIDGNCARKVKTVAMIARDNFLHYLHRFSGGKPKGVYMLDVHKITDAGVMRVGVLSGACMLVRKDIMIRLGGFDPNTFLYYEEDILAEKVRREGLGCYLALGLKCVHIGAATTQKVPMTQARMKLMMRSQRYYVTRYSGAGAFMRALHWVSLQFFLLSFFVQKKSGLRLRR